MHRRNFIKSAAVFGGALTALDPFQALSERRALGLPPHPSTGYGPLVNKGDLWLPADFNYQIISVQGQVMSDGNVTPGIFDGMAAYPGRRGNTILIRNHENREQPGEQKVLTPAGTQYNESAFAGNTKLEVRRQRAGRDPVTGQRLFTYEVVRDFAILGGTSTNCAGGIRSPHSWLACEEVVKRLNGKKHGYLFEIDAESDCAVQAIPVTQCGRRAHEAAVEADGIIYMTEDRSITPDPRLGLIGSCFYRYRPRPRNGRRPLVETSGPLEALKLKDEFHANMDVGRQVGVPLKVEWVPVMEPDHDDDADNRLDRVPGFTPNRVQAQDLGAAFFDRLEGMWANESESRIYFDCTTGGPANLGQVWEYRPKRELLTLIYESSDSAALQSPDNVVVVPRTGDILLQEDGSGAQFVRGVTRDGEIYDFARTGTNESEFCGGCFDPQGHTFYLNQQGDRGNLPNGPLNNNAVTFAIYGPF